MMGIAVRQGTQRDFTGKLGMSDELRGISGVCRRKCNTRPCA
jgi:hypothetical protein